MGFFLLPVAVFSFWIGLNSIESVNAQNKIPSATVKQAEYSAQTFVRYRNAVMLYQQINPSFTGNVTSAMLSTLGSQFTTAFLTIAGNTITATGATGRIITCYAALPTGAITKAIEISKNDASLGIATGTTWKSYAYGASQTAVTLPTAVPNGNVVSVIQIGN